MRSSVELLSSESLLLPPPSSVPEGSSSSSKEDSLALRVRTLLQGAGDSAGHDISQLCEILAGKYAALIDKEKALDESAHRSRVENEELREQELLLQSRVRELEGDLYALRIKHRNMETEKNQEIRKLHKDIKELEKTKKITLNRDKQYQVRFILEF